MKRFIIFWVFLLLFQFCLADTTFFEGDLGVCSIAAFMFYGFFGIAIDVFYTISFVAVVGIFFILWRQTK